LNSATFERLIHEQQPHIQRVMRDLARRYHLAATEIDDFARQIERALERNDFELLRAYDRRSTWETYLTTVVTRLFFGFQSELWGQWRPSAAAQRLGPTAMLLEELISRDRLACNDAAQLMRTTYHVDLPRHRIEALARDLGLIEDGDLFDAVGSQPSGDLHAPSLQIALRDAMALLSADDRLLMTMRYVDHQPITRIAKALRNDPRPLQRRIEQAKEVLRTSLLTQGIAMEDVDALLLQAEVDANSPHRKWWMMVLARPSQ